MQQSLKIVQISDLHFGPPYLSRVGEALLQAVVRLTPDVIVASGDFTQRAREEQFQQAREFLDRLPSVPRIVTPGNHDVPLIQWRRRLFSPYDFYRRYIHGDLDYSLTVPGAVFVSVNSTNALRAVTNGRISRQQLQLCRQTFTSSDEKSLRVVVTHHHFVPAPDYEHSEVMRQAKRAIDTFHDLNVDIVLSGHLHRAFIGHSLDFYPVRGRSRGIIIVHCGTSTSRRGRGRERDKNSFNLIHAGPETVRITHYMYFEEILAFAPISRHVFPRAANRFFRSQRTMGPADVAIGVRR